MDDALIRGYEARLRAELDSLEVDGGLGAEDRATVVLDQQAVGRLSRLDALQRQAMAEAHARRIAVRRARIDMALGRIRDGGFGWCAECGEEVAEARLDLDPAAPTCIRCASG
jgi:DnaK suppressor protein